MAEIETQDVASVGSRVSWGAILAGAFVALTLSIFLTALGGALGLTVIDHTDVRGDQLATGAGIWSIASLLIALFVGGFVTSRCTVGERKTEGAMYGVLVWGVMVVAMATAGAAGSGAYLGLSNYMAQSGTAMTQPRAQQFTMEQYRQAGWNNVTQEKLNEMRQSARNTADNTSPMAAAWWAFAGIGFSLFAAVAGGLVGAGPEFVLRYFHGRRVITSTPSHHA